MHLILGILVMMIPSMSGIVLSYVWDTDSEPGWRLPTGIVVGVALISVVAFPVCCKLGLTDASVALCLTAVALPLLILRERGLRLKILSDISNTANSVVDFVSGRFPLATVGTAFYLFLTGIFLIYFFSRAMFIMPDGIYSGDVSNYGDLPFHIGIVAGFVDGSNFPPQHPELSGSSLKYHFLADLYAAILMHSGLSLEHSFFIENCTLGLCLFALAHRYAWTLTHDRLATFIGPVITFLSGGLGFEVLTQNARDNDEGILHLIWHPIQNYTISVPQQTDLQWGNILTTQLMTQRPFLLGLPLLLIVCIALHQIVHKQPEHLSRGVKNKLIGIGALIGLMPLAHIFCYAAALAVALMATLSALRNRHLVLGFVYTFTAAFVVSGPQLIWLLHGTRGIGVSPSTFHPSYHPGWMADNTNWIVFWLRNAGPFIPLLICAYALPDIRKSLPKATLLLSIPFVLFFAVVNLAQISPWIWDNSKMLVIWYFGTAPLVALALTTAARLGSRPWGPITAIALGLCLILAGGLDVWRVTRLANPVRIFDADDMAMAQIIQASVPVGQSVLTAPSCFTSGILSGRTLIEGYPGHLWSQGYSYDQRNADVTAIYAGSASASELMKKYGIRYVVVGPLERATLSVNLHYFAQFRPVAISGMETLYDTSVRTIN